MGLSSIFSSIPGSIRFGVGLPQAHKIRQLENQLEAHPLDKDKHVALLKAKLSGSEQHAVDLHKAIQVYRTEKEEELARYQEELEENFEDFLTLQAKAKQAQQDHVRELNHLHVKISQLTEDTHALNRVIGEQYKHISSIENLSRLHEARANATGTVVDTLRHECKRYHSRCSRLRNTIKGLEESLDARDSNIDFLQADSDELVDARTTASRYKSTIDFLLSQAKAKDEEHARAIGDLQNSLDVALATKVAETKVLKAELSLSSIYANECAADCSALKQQLGQALDDDEDNGDNKYVEDEDLEDFEDFEDDDGEDDNDEDGEDDDNEDDEDDEDDNNEGCEDDNYEDGEDEYVVVN